MNQSRDGEKEEILRKEYEENLGSNYKRMEKEMEEFRMTPTFGLGT